MAIGHGAQILQADLTAVAAYANSLAAPTRLPRDVSPMNYLSGARYGYRQLKDVAIVKTNRGTGYKRGDYLQGFGGYLLLNLQVEAVDAGGGLLGIRVVTLYPADATSTLPGSPADITSIFGGAVTAGTGAKISFSVEHIGPDADYSFPEFYLNQGIMTDLIIAAAGGGYQVNDVLTLPDFSGLGALALTVTAVGANGTITNFSISDPGYLNTARAIPANITALPATGGNGKGAIFSGLHTMLMPPKWKTELERLRGNLNSYFYNLPSASKYSPVTLAVSGPWPVSGLSADYKNQEFWFEDPGYAVSVIVGGTGYFAAQGEDQRQVIYNVTQGYDYSTGQIVPVKTPYVAQVIQKKFAIVVGGTGGGTLTAFFYVMAEWYRGFTKTAGQNAVYDSVPNNGDTVNVFTVTTTLPGAVITQRYKGGNSNVGMSGYVIVGFEYSGVIAPGRYEFTLTYNNPPGDDSYYDYPYGNAASGYRLTRVLMGLSSSTGVLFATKNQSTFDSPVSPASDNWPTYNVTFSNAVAAPGISKDFPVKKIACGTFAPIIYSVIQYYTTYDNLGTNSNPIIMPTAWGPEQWINSFPFSHPANYPGAGYSTTVPGLWTGQTQAVSDLCVAMPANMPWNIARTKRTGAGNFYTENPMLLGSGNPDNIAASNSYDQAITVEGQKEPARWAVKKWFTVGFVISDANGFGLFKCTTAGYSGAVEPGWNLTLGGSTNETHDTPPTGGQNTWATWQCVKLFKPADTWVAGKTWNIGDQCVDSNGNTQTIVSNWKPFQPLTAGQFITDENNNTQQVLTAGTTGATKPTWATSLNATTADGSVVWKLVILGSSSASSIIEPSWATTFGVVTQDGAAYWQLTGVMKGMKPALHRARPVPRYPVYWESETIAALKPPTTASESEKTIWGCGNQWFKSSYVNSSGQTSYEAGWQEKFNVPGGGTIGNLARGWWIYSVSLNRIQKFPANISGAGTIGAGEGGIGAGNGSVGAGGGGNYTPVQVTIGCIRNGSFVAFGSYVTGQTVRVLWPIFTSDALVYQCTERVDVQAVAIGIGSTGVAIGLGGVSQPIACAYFTDTVNLLQFVQ
jgi:hypothetical protein